MMSPETVFSLLYILFVICVIYPPVEVATAGLIIPKIFSKLLGNEFEDFISYHMRKMCVTLVVYSSLPLGYLLCSTTFGDSDGVMALWNYSFLWHMFNTMAIMLPIVALVQVYDWYKDNWKNHPISRNLSNFCNNNHNWSEIASNINTEFRSVDKTVISTNQVTCIVATDNWIIKLTPLSCFFTHQSDATLVVNKADTHSLSHITLGQAQYLNIEVKSGRNNVKPFILRINSIHFRELQDRISRVITVLPEIKFQQTLIEKFIEAFRENVMENVRYKATQDLETCLGCMQITSNVKLQKLCPDVPVGNCTACYCKPMWCLDCMARWFAHRQEVDESNNWLSKKSTCPMCRAKFCLLDICFLEEQTPAE